MRVRNWEIRLIQALDEEREKPFGWGPSDCGRLLQLSIRACLGDDHPLLELDWSDEASARKILSASGGLEGLLSQHFEEIGWMQAGTGDIGTFGPVDTAAGLVVVDGSCAGKTARKGFFRIPTAQATRLFKVQ